MPYGEYARLVRIPLEKHWAAYFFLVFIRGCLERGVEFFQIWAAGMGGGRLERRAYYIGERVEFVYGG